MFSSSRILAALTALALSSVAAPLAGAAYAPTPKLSKHSSVLFVDNEIGKGAVAVAFRTDRKLDRKGNGKSIDGRAAIQGGNASLSTFAKGKAAYIAHIGGVSVAGGGRHLKVGQRYRVTISLGDTEVTRTVKLQANTRESAVKRQLGV